MPFRIAFILRRWCALAVLGSAAVFAGEVPHEWVGLNREQVIRKLGEPRSQLQAGNRLVMLYPRERITFRDGVVVDVEVLATEPARRATAPGPVAVPAAPPVQAPVASLVSAPTAANQPAPPAPTASPFPSPSVPSQPLRVVPAPGTSSSVAPAVVPPPPGGVTVPPPRAELPPAPEPESRLGIKLVRPPSGRDGVAPLPASVAVPAQPSVQPPAVVTPMERQLEASPVPAPAPVAASAPPIGAQSEPSAPSAPAGFTALPVETPREIVERANRAAATAPAATPPAPVESRKDSLSSKLLRERLDRAEAAAQEESGFPWSSVGIGAAVLAAGVAFLLHRRSRGSLVETPVAATAREAASAGLGGIGAQREKTSFTVEGLAKLEWKRFQEVVEAYYYKTGVVALRTRAGPQSPVHIKISWKGESRPFACVRCIPAPKGTIGPAPLEELLAVLDADKIRRGYVVSPGVFNGAARELAERTQLTLMAGDTLREKLNALPESARAEIMQLAQSGEPSVPSCPVCESKMSLSRENPPVWRCASHPDQSFPAEG